MADGQFTQVFALGSGEPPGSRFLIAATSIGAPDLMHTSLTDLIPDSSDYQYIDYLTVDAHNTDTSPRTINLMIGAGSLVVSVDLVPGIPPVPIFDRAPLTGGQTLEAFASVTNKIHLGIRIERFKIGA